MNSIVKIAPLGMVAAFAHDVQAQQWDVRPNIVVIVADDLASHEIGCYGGTNISTPNIDRIL
jgi:arylsulfatase A-like enzyme